MTSTIRRLQPCVAGLQLLSRDKCTYAGSNVKIKCVSPFGSCLGSSSTVPVIVMHFACTSSLPESYTCVYKESAPFSSSRVHGRPLGEVVVACCGVVIDEAVLVVVCCVPVVVEKCPMCGINSIESMPAS